MRGIEVEETPESKKSETLKNLWCWKASKWQKLFKEEAKLV